MAAVNLLVAWVALLAAAIGEQQPRQISRPSNAALQEGVIAGVVWSADDGTPARGAIVTVSSDPLPFSRSTISDDDGRFILGQLPTGRLRLSVSKPAYIWSVRDNRRADGLELSARERIEDLVLVLRKGAAISGFVSDASGASVEAARVTLLRATAGSRFADVPGASAFTDDRGYYRLFGLQPGEYLVSVLPRPGTLATEISTPSTAEIDALFAAASRGVRDFRSGSGPSLAPQGNRATLAPVYHPGVLNASAASRVVLKYGDDHQRADILMVHGEMATVEGTVEPLPPKAEAVVTLASEDGVLVSTRQPTIRSTDGRFSFRGVTPGVYVIQARVQDGSRSPQWARTTVRVDGSNVTGVVLTPEPAIRISGRLVMDDGANPPLNVLRTIRIEAWNAMSGDLRPGTTVGLNAEFPAASAVPASDGGFVIDGLTRGPHSLRVPGLPDSLYVVSVRVGETEIWGGTYDVSHQSGFLEVLISNRPSRLRGVVDLNGVDERRGHFEVVAFPVDSRLRLRTGPRILTTAVDKSGRYEFARLPPGSYHVAAIQGFEPPSELPPSVFDELAAVAPQVSLRLGESRELHLRLLAAR